MSGDIPQNRGQGDRNPPPSKKILKQGCGMLKRLISFLDRNRIFNNRDTDVDWKLIGEDEPYFGVLTSEEFKRSNFDNDARMKFYGSGWHDVTNDLEQMRKLFGEFNPRSALDFGCGVGRLTMPLAEITGDAVGVDISPGMLAEARVHEGPRLSFMEKIPDRKFAWVVSRIVLQHIPPERGYALLKQLLASVENAGGATIQIVFARTQVHARSAGARLIHSNDDSYYATPPRHHKIPPGSMLMHDYDLSLVVSLFFAAGFRSLHLEHTDHGGMIGAVIYARKFSA